MFDTLRKVLVLLGPSQRGRWVLVILLALVASGFEALGALIVFGLLASITTDASGFDVPVLGDLRTLFPGADEHLLIAVIGGAIALFFVVRAATLVVQGYVQYRLAENAGARLASQLLEGYLAMPYTFHLQRNSAELIRNMYETVQQFVREALLPAVKLVGHSLICLGLVAVLVYTSPLATLFAAAVLGPFTWMLLRVVHPRVKQLGHTAQEMAKTSLQTLEESLTGWRDIKILGRERFFVEQFEEDRRRLARAKYLRSTAKEVPRVALETGLVLFILAFLGVSAIVRDGALEALPVLGLFGYVAVRLQPSLNEIMVALNSLKFVGPGIDLIHRDLQLFPATPAGRAGQPQALRLRGELRLDGVSARYPGAHREALRDVNVSIRAGEFIGVVGPTGGGKTTLVELMLGLLEPATGRVLVDGVDLRWRTEAWQASLGVVHQVVFLADATLRRNIALGVPDEEVDDALVAETVKLAQLERFVQSLPEGLDTMIGQRGVRLSGGQRQRLAIARALYRRPSVLILDEGTSALDNNTEAELMAALEPLRGERTIIAVAHRLSTVAACDRVVLVDDGHLVDVAPFDELASRHGEVLVAAR
jgi:ABC-type multidrug transport system fused ATPase/permease subunit